MHILFIADPLESFQTYKDTTFAMMREAQRRGHRIAACLPQDLQWKSGGVVEATQLPRVHRPRDHLWSRVDPRHSRWCPA